MANQKVTIWKNIKLLNGQWRYCRPVVGKTNKIKPDWVKVNSHEEHHPEGYYVLHYLEGKKQVWAKCGPLATTAVELATRKEAVLRAVAAGIAVPDQNNSPILLRAAMKNYLADYELSQRPESYALMKQTLEEWLAFSRKHVAHDIKRIDLLQYKADLIRRGRSERTAGNKMLRVNQFMRWVLKLDPGKGLVTVKDAKFVEQEPEVYNEEDLKKFFEACGPFHLAVFKTFLMSGLRKQELENLTHQDISYHAGTLKVCAKPGFRPKTWEERTIEVPTDLLDIFKTLPRRGELVFANGNGQKYTHAWDDAKDIEKRAGLKGFHPHGFRTTYATKLLQSGVDLKTVQKLLGHKNLESTMRYLAKAESSAVRLKVNAAWNGKH
jgi:integrase/recombinase XerD